MELKKPKKKRYFGKSFQSPSLPVFIDSFPGVSASDSYWPVFLGTFSGDSVVISNRDEMKSLYDMGIFGKGSLSRSYPSFGEHKKGVPPVIRERQWKRRKMWMDQLLSFSDRSLRNQKLNDHELPSSSTKEPEMSSAKDNDNLLHDLYTTAMKKTYGVGDKDHAGAITDIENTTTINEHCSHHYESSVVVVNDCIGDIEEQQIKSLQPRLNNEPIKTAVESLNLTLEEAFFLSFGLGCLQVIDLHGVLLCIKGMWKLYTECQPDFVSSYVTYHYFRSKGWIVKPGVKFGGNFLLYKQGPSFYHASYILLIEDVNNPFEDKKIKRHLSQTKLIGLNRIAENAGKEILLAHIQWPEGITSEDLTNPKIISKFKVQELLFRRWNPENERKEKD